MQGLKVFEEARAKLITLNEQHLAGTLSQEALTASSRELDVAMDNARGYLDRATKLNTIDRGSEALRALEPDPEQPDTPNYLRPMGHDGVDQLDQLERGSHPTGPQLLEAAPQPIMIGGYGLSPEQLATVSRLSGVQPHQYRLLTGKTREVCQRLLKHNKLRANKQVTKEELEWLANPPGAEHLNVSPYIDRDGGYFVAQEMRSEIIGYLRDRRHIRSRARVIPTNAASVAFPTMQLKLSLKSTRAHKGKTDGSAPQTMRDIIGKTEFTPSGKSEMVKVPEQLVEDLNFDLIGFISEEIAMQAFDDEEGLFLTGTGVNQPYGVLSVPTLPGVAHTGASAALFKPEDIKTLPYQVREVHRTPGVWMAHRNFYTKVVVMRSDSGAGAGTGEFLFQPGLRAGEPATIGGYELLESEFFPDHVDGTGGASQAVGDPMVLFGDWRQYWIVERLNFEIKIFDQLYAEAEQLGFRYRKRLDAAPVRLESWVTLNRKA